MDVRAIEDILDELERGINSLDITSPSDLLDYVRKIRALLGNQVEHPSHYTVGNAECIEILRGILSEEEFRGFCVGNGFAYLWRRRFKGGDSDLAKCRFYLGVLLDEAL